MNLYGRTKSSEELLIQIKQVLNTKNTVDLKEIAKLIRDKEENWRRTPFEAVAFTKSFGFEVHFGEFKWKGVKAKLTIGEEVYTYSQIFKSDAVILVDKKLSIESARVLLTQLISRYILEYSEGFYQVTIGSEVTLIKENAGGDLKVEPIESQVERENQLKAERLARELLIPEDRVMTEYQLAVRNQSGLARDLIIIDKLSQEFGVTTKEIKKRLKETGCNLKRKMLSELIKTE